MVQPWARRVVASVLTLGLLAGKGNAAVFWVPVVQPMPPENLTLEMLQTGYLSDPWASNWVKALVMQGDLTPDEVDDPSVEIYQQGATLEYRGDGASTPETHTVVVIYQVDKKGGSGSDDGDGWKKWIIKAVIAALIAEGGKIGKTLISCAMTAGEDELSTDCQRQIAEAGGAAQVGEGANRAYGLSRENLALYLEKKDALAHQSHALLVLQKDKPTGEVHSYQESRQVPMDVAPRILPRIGRMLIPIRFLGMAGLDIKWNPEPPGIVVVSRPMDGLSVEYRVGQTTARVNDGRALSFDVPPTIDNGRVMVGLRATLEPFCSVKWQRWNQRVMMKCGQ